MEDSEDEQQQQLCSDKEMRLQLLSPQWRISCSYIFVHRCISHLPTATVYGTSSCTYGWAELYVRSDQRTSEAGVAAP